jgi:hypothetical protein
MFEQVRAKSGLEFHAGNLLAKFWISQVPYDIHARSRLRIQVFDNVALTSDWGEDGFLNPWLIPSAKCRR